MKLRNIVAVVAIALLLASAIGFSGLKVFAQSSQFAATTSPKPTATITPKPTPTTSPKPTATVTPPPTTKGGGFPLWAIVAIAVGAVLLLLVIILLLRTRRQSPTK